MKKIVVTVMVLMCSEAFGLTLMGPPRAGLTEGQYRAGLDYTYSEMDLEISGYGESWTEDVETNMLFGNFGYGIIDNCEGFVRLGFANVEAEDFDGDNEFAYGFGTKLTFAEQDAVTWGVLFQIGWFEGEDTVTGFVPGFGIVTADQEVDAYEIQVSVGPTYDAGNIRIYGGPFLHFVDGDYDVDIAGVGSGSFDVEQESEFGAYIGAQMDISTNSPFNIEAQFTGDAWALGFGIGWKF